MRWRYWEVIAGLPYLQWLDLDIPYILATMVGTYAAAVLLRWVLPAWRRLHTAVTTVLVGAFALLFLSWLLQGRWMWQLLDTAFMMVGAGGGVLLVVAWRSSRRDVPLPYGAWLAGPALALLVVSALHLGDCVGLPIEVVSAETRQTHLARMVDHFLAVAVALLGAGGFVGVASLERGLDRTTSRRLAFTSVVLVSLGGLTGMGESLAEGWMANNHGNALQSWGFYGQLWACALLGAVALAWVGRRAQESPRVRWATSALVAALLVAGLGNVEAFSQRADRVLGLTDLRLRPECPVGVCGRSWIAIQEGGSYPAYRPLLATIPVRFEGAPAPVVVPEEP